MFEGGKTITGHISQVRETSFGGDPKLTITIDDKLALTLNRPNGAVIATAYGDDPERWVGGRVRLQLGTARFNGQDIPSIVVRTPRHDPGAAPAVDIEPEYSPPDGDVPF